MKKKNGIDAGADVIVNAVLIGKARSKVISAAKRWNKAWKNGEVTQATDTMAHHHEHHPADLALSAAVEKLERLENPAKNQNSRRLSDGK